MAKKMTATKGGMTVVGAYLDITSARLIKFYEATAPGPVLTQKWWAEWRLFPSQQEAEKPRGTGVPLDQGELFLEYVKGNDPVEDAYELMMEELEKTWEASNVTEVEYVPPPPAIPPA